MKVLETAGAMNHVDQATRVSVGPRVRILTPDQGGSMLKRRGHHQRRKTTRQERSEQLKSRKNPRKEDDQTVGVLQGRQAGKVNPAAGDSDRPDSKRRVKNLASTGSHESKLKKTSWSEKAY